MKIGMTAGLILLVVGGCSGHSDDPMDPFSECKQILEEARKEARKTDQYSYSSSGFSDCIQPLREKELENWRPPKPIYYK